MIYCEALDVLLRFDGDTMYIRPAKNLFNAELRITLEDILADLASFIVLSKNRFTINSKNVSQAVIAMIVALCCNHVYALHIECDEKVNYYGKFVRMPNLSNLSIFCNANALVLARNNAEQIHYFVCNVPVLPEGEYLMFKNAKIVELKTDSTICVPKGCLYPRNVDVYVKAD